MTKSSEQSKMNPPSQIALLRLMHLVSPALPVGAYAYSQGQEYAIDAQWLKSESEITDWISGILIHSIGQLDIPCLQRFYLAWEHDDHEAVLYWNQFVIASRETSELLLEDLQLGAALQRLLIALEPDNKALTLMSKPSFISLFALAGVLWSIPLNELVRGFAWSWVENQVAAATKTVPLGQTQAQKILVSLMPVIEQSAHYGQTVPDEKIGSGLPAVAIASSLHERQYSRLFRS